MQAAGEEKPEGSKKESKKEEEEKGGKWETNEMLKSTGFESRLTSQS